MTIRLIFLLAFFFSGCGCSVEILMTNQSTSDQVVKVSYDGEPVTQFTLKPHQQTLYKYRDFGGLSLEFPIAVPNATFVAQDVDHWLGMTHKFQLTILQDSLWFKDYGATGWIKTYK
jgi:hypothetical protein